MTEASLLDIIERWQKRLKLDSFSISAAFDDATLDEASDACVNISADYDRAWIKFNPDSWSQWDRQRANEVVVHELLHVMTRDIDESTKAVMNLVRGDTWALAHSRHDHELENFVDSMALRLIELGGLC